MVFLFFGNGCLQWFFFGNLVIAAALFYLAELVEEYTVLTAKVIKAMVAVSRTICRFTVRVIPMQ